MKRLLILTHYFPPSGASGALRMLGFARHLPRHDWKVSVVACGPTPWEPHDPGLAETLSSQVSVRYVEFPMRRLRRFHVRAMVKGSIFLDRYQLWNREAALACEEVARLGKPDVLLTSSPPHSVHLLGRRLQSRFRIPWVADYRDPWCCWGNDKPIGSQPTAWTRYRERHVMQDADAVLVNSPNAKEAFRADYPQLRRKCVVVPNGYDPPLQHHRPTSRAEHCRNELSLLHAGSLYVGRDPRPLLSTLDRLCRSSELPDVRVIFLGRCADADIAAAMARRDLAFPVDVRGQVSYQDAKREMAQASALVLLDSPGRRVGVPAKLYEYLSVYKPVLAFAEEDGDTAAVLRESNAAHCIVPYHLSESLPERVLGFVRRVLQRPSAVPPPNGNSIHKAFTREASVRRLVGVLDELAENPS